MSDEQRRKLAKLYRRLDELAFQANLPAIGIGFVSGAALVAVLWSYQDARSFLAYWGAALFCVTVLRLGAHFFCAASIRKPAQLKPEKSLFSRQNILVGLAASAVLWSVLAIGSMSRLPETATFFVVLVVFCLSTGATGTLAPLENAARLYFAIMLVPISIAFILPWDQRAVLGCAGLVFLGLNILFHRANRQTIVRLEELQLANRKLADDLKQERTELAHLNDSLESQVQDRTQELRFLAHHDSLTGLFNRSGLMNWVLECQPGSSPETELAVLFIDLDRFKQINDVLGHGVGDEILKEVAHRLLVGAPDNAAICRWGGDEFIILLPQAHEKVLEAGRELADHLRVHTEQPITVQSKALHICFSAGVSVAGMTVKSVDEAIQSADLAMGEAKRGSRGITRIYSDELTKKHERKLTIVQSLRNAIPDKEFTIALQPIVDANTFETKSQEVLLRWSTPLLGSVGPDEFIPIAEDSGEIIGIGKYVLDQALTELSASDYGRSGGRIAINVSVRQLIDEAWAPSVLQALERTGIESTQLVIEVTETALDRHDLADIAASLEMLAGRGIEIQVDDFGTGYSSLSRLHQLPISALKIDRSFVMNMDNSGLAVIEGSVLIARKSGLKVIAEGVETRDQALSMRALGVDFLQGYYFGRPMAGMDKEHVQPLITKLNKQVPLC